MSQEIVGLKEGEKRVLSQVLQALRSIRYGSVQIVVQDSKVVQIDKTEKIRIGKDDFFGFGSGV